MSYFDKVYLKRVNRFGNTVQERIQGQKVYDFKNRLEKSPNKVLVYKDNRQTWGILENKTNSESERVDYLLTNKNSGFADGTIIITENASDSVQKKWLVFHLEEYVSIGYDKYQIIEMDRNIQWIEDGIVYDEAVHFTGSGANLRDKTITSKFTISFDVAAMYQPNKILTLTMRTHPKMKKGMRILIGDEVWKVSGMDKISVPGVSYITLEEDYIDKVTDIKVANSDYLKNWNIQSSLGDTINLTVEDGSLVDFTLYYNDIIRQEPIRVKVLNKKIAEYKNGEFDGLAIGETDCVVSLINCPEVNKTFKIKVNELPQDTFTIIGPERITILSMTDYLITGGDSDISIESLNNNFEIVGITDNIITINGVKIGKDKLIVKKDNEIIFEKSINIDSIWLEG